MKRRTAILCSLAFLVTSWPVAVQAAPRAKPKKVDANAKKMDVLKAVDDKQIEVQVVVQGPATALLTMTNLSENPLSIEVPLALGAVPNVPQGANEAYYLSAFGTTGAPQSLAIGVNPNWATGVDKKAGSRKTNVKTNKKAKDGDDEAKDEKKGDDADTKKDEAKKSDSLVAVVPLPPGATQQLTLSALGLERSKPRANIGFYRLAELDKVSMATELKKLLEQFVQGKIPADTAQILAWYYHGRHTWEEMATTALPAQIEVAKQYADIVEGKAAPETAPAADSKKKKR